MSDDIPTEYNELVALVENNDPGVVAQTILANFTPNSDLEALADEWRDKRQIAAGDREIGSMNRTLVKCANELEALIEEHSHE